MTDQTGMEVILLRSGHMQTASKKSPSYKCNAWTDFEIVRSIARVHSEHAKNSYLHVLRQCRNLQKTGKRSDPVDVKTCKCCWRIPIETEYL